uniref:Putative reverse transcriptase domain-containing protein n=1 Tax=Tanacetum cinerariifolium TaxID=118510 RepID=A0A6L2K9F3_TANCI|nr:putative reverse transcriptase domain-containing protein [Tanacetum cinerariifolium]
MVNARHKEVKASTSKEAKLSASDAEHDHSDNGSSLNSEDLNFRGFTDEETKVLSSMIRKQVGKTIKNVVPYFISQTTDNLKDFQTLAQTNETVNEMWKKFNDLICYCSEYHGNEKLKVEIFQRMLRDDFREVIFPFKCTTLDALLSRARVREANLLMKKNKEAKETKRKLEFGDRDTKKPKNDHIQRSDGTQIKTPCKKCHKTHLEVCRANLSGCYKCDALNHMSKDYKKPMILCYNCNQLGHKLNECPNSKAIKAKPLKSIKEEKVEKEKVPNLKARVYMLATKEDKLVHDVVTCMIIVSSIPARVLYDSGASVSFVSYEFSKKLSTPLSKLPSPLEVKIADNKAVVVSNVYREIEIEINDSTFRIDLISIIQKLVRVVNPQGREIIIYGDKRKDISSEKKSEKDVPVVKEFLDVFPKDLPGIPPERQGEFRIDLISGATPIAKTSYRLAPFEVKELMSEFQELLDKGFIRPSSSPWGALIFFVMKKDGSMRMCIDYRLASYYRRFIQDFSKIASSLTKLTKKNTPFMRGKEQEEAFDTLRKKLCEAPILVLLEGTEDMVVYSDASYSGLRCVLMQQDFQKELGTKLHTSTTFHPQMDGQSEQTIQMLEDMLRVYVIDFGGNCDDHLPLVEFAYNNSYHAIIKIPPYEMLYSRRCRTLVCCEEVGSRELASTDVVLATTEKIETIRERLKEAQDRWKSYANNRRRLIEFKVGDFVMLKVSSWKGVLRFKNKGKLSPRFIGAFKILKQVREVAYILELPKEIRGIYNTFHVSYLRKCLADESSVITLDDIEINTEITTQEEPVAILGRKSRQICNKQISLVKVQWKHHKGTSIRWEPEDMMKIKTKWCRQCKEKKYLGVIVVAFWITFRVLFFSFTVTDGNSSSVNIKQHCGRGFGIGGIIEQTKDIYSGMSIAGQPETTVDEYLTKVRDDSGPRIVKPLFEENIKFKFWGQCIDELKENVFFESENEDPHKHISNITDIVDLFHSLGVSRDQKVDFKGPIHRMTPAARIEAIIELSKRSLSWYEKRDFKNKDLQHKYKLPDEGRISKLEETLSTIIEETRRKQKENENLFGKIKKSYEKTLKKQASSIKTIKGHLGRIVEIIHGREVRSLPSFTETNPRGLAHAITTRSGPNYNPPKNPLEEINDTQKQNHEKHIYKKEEKVESIKHWPISGLALANLGASISLIPYSMFLILNLGELKPTCMCIELANKSSQIQKGIAKNVIFKIDSWNETITFDLEKSMRFQPSDDDTCHSVDIIDLSILDHVQEILPPEPFDSILFEPINHHLPTEINSLWDDNEGEQDLINQISGDLEPESEDYTKPTLFAANMFKGEKPTTKLKDFLSHLEYAFLDNNKEFLVINSSLLSSQDKELLLGVLTKHKSALAWKVADIKGISPSFCTHKILMDDNFKPVVQPQHRLNPKVQDAVKTEIIKLLDADLIYAIYDSPWEEQAAQSFTPYWNFSMIDDEEVLQFRENFMKALQTFLQQFSRYSFGVMPKVLLIAWERFFEIKHAFTDKQYQPEEIQELMCKLLEDVRDINEELSEYINSPSWNHPTFYNDDEEHSIQYKEYLKNSSNAIAPVLPTEKPEYSLSMGYEHPSTIPEMESDEVINLEEENVVYQEEKEIDLDDILQIQDVILREKLLSINRLIVDIEFLNDNHTPDRVLKSSSSFPIFENTTAHANNSHPEYDSFCFEIEPDLGRLNSIVMKDISDNLTNDSLLEEVDLYLVSDNSIPPGIGNIDYDSEGDIHFLEKSLSDDSFPLPKNESSNFDHHDDPSFPRPPPEPPDVEVFFDFEPDLGELISAVMNNIDELNEDICFDPGRVKTPFLTLASPLRVDGILLGWNFHVL